MEGVLDAYRAAYDERNPLVGMDEASRQLLGEVVAPLPLKPGRPRRVDDKYERRGVRSPVLFVDPLRGWRRVACRESRTRADWAEEVRRLLEEDYPDAETVTLVCDNPDTHHVASLYHRFDAETAGRLRRRLRLVFTPKNGSWLNLAEMELSVLSRQCLGGRRFGTAADLDAAVAAWQEDRNARRCGLRWRFTTNDARTKLASLYPQPDI